MAVWSTPTTSRPSTSRSRTWPPLPNILARQPASSDMDDLVVEGKGKLPHADLKSFQESLDQNPEEHFLSPVQMYEDDAWSSDSEDDDDDDDDNDKVAWGAGITDFALFDEDRQRARASGKAIPQKWEHMLESQASALSRAIERTRQDSSDSQLSRTPSDENLPDLMPDASPQLCDDLDLVDSYHGQTAPRPIIPEHLRSITSAPSMNLSQSAPSGSASNNTFECVDLSSYVPRRIQSSIHNPKHKQARPGLRDGRTLSGKEHVWRRPSFEIFTVREDPAAESRAERSCCTTTSGEQDSHAGASRERE